MLVTSRDCLSYPAVIVAHSHSYHSLGGTRTDRHGARQLSSLSVKYHCSLIFFPREFLLDRVTKRREPRPSQRVAAAY
ncbi:hypothetical protein PUN28_004769 [Cardiocondyla obscurior]|uniref:Uncharacterized protein n=1 Tax=Cardiocondyla obscurior TaxID=286306 RepID=A0AAW2GCH7_9HYME